MCCLILGPARLLVIAVKSVLTDRKFQLSSPQAITALKSAKDLVKLWNSEPQKHQPTTDFAQYLVDQLKTCFQTKAKSMHLKKERMWGKYHQLRTSSAFKLEWKKFLGASIRVSNIYFFQHLTHKVFTELINLEFPLVTETDGEGTSDTITTTEKNALRYVAGYVCRKVKDNLISAHCKIPNKQCMIQCLLDISSNTGDDLDCNEWVSMVNRGGLWRINDDVYSVFVMMEELIRPILRKEFADQIDEGTKKKIVDKILSDEDLLFQWCFVVRTVVDTELSEVLLKQIAELYLTMRGHAFASSCLELYKQASKQSLQKKKGLRTKLSSSQ